MQASKCCKANCKKLPRLCRPLLIFLRQAASQQRAALGTSRQRSFTLIREQLGAYGTLLLQPSRAQSLITGVPSEYLVLGL